MSHIRYEILEKKASSFGGLHGISKLYDVLQFDELFVKSFGDYRKTRKYTPSENIKMLIASIIVGGARLSDINRLNFDSVLPDLFGNGSVPCDTTLRNDLQKIGNLPEARDEFLFQLNELLLQHSKVSHMTIEIDGTASKVEGHQTGARKGYIPGHQGKRCFQHILVSWDEMDSPLYMETRSGNTYCAEDAAKIVEKVIDRFAPLVDTILCRADSGFYISSLLNLLDRYDNVSYVVKAKYIEGIIALVANKEFRSYHGSERTYATCEYTMKNSKPRKYYVERIRKNDEAYLFEEISYDYAAIVTNLENKQPHAIYNLYKERGRQEKLICEMKNEYALGRIISNDFHVTKAASWVSALVGVTISLFRQVALRHEYRRFRLKRLRYYFFNVVSKFIYRSRCKILQIFSPPIGSWRYDQVINRIQAFT